MISIKMVEVCASSITGYQYLKHIDAQILFSQ